MVVFPVKVCNELNTSLRRISHGLAVIKISSCSFFLLLELYAYDIFFSLFNVIVMCWADLVIYII